MPNWKKVITSGSAASLYSLDVSNGITGSLLGTASWAINALTSSYALNLTISGSITSVNHIDFNTSSAVPTYQSGRIFWDNADGALSVYNSEADITLQVGQENWVRVFNQTGATITNGTPVKIIGAQGDVPKIVLAQSFQISGSTLRDNQIIGLAAHDIETNSIGYVTTQGLVRGLNTNAFTDGDLLFVSSSAGLITNIVPPPPCEVIQVGICVKAGPGGSGIIFVFPTQPIDFSDLSSTEKGTTYSYGDLWTYVLTGSVGVWRHTNQLSGSYAITGSLKATSFTGSLLGTSSYALQALSSSFALTASYVANASSFPYTGSAVITGSLTITGSTISTDGFTGSLYGTAITASYVSPTFISSSAAASGFGSGGGGGETPASKLFNYYNFT